MEDLACWAAFLAGDKKGFEALYNRHYDMLYAYGKGWSRDANLIEESIQDLFVKLWRNRENLDYPADVRFYLMKALRNTLINKFSAVRREECVEGFGDWEAGVTFAEDAEELPAEVQRSINSLTPRQKEAIHLFFYENMSYQELSEQMRIHIGGAYKLVYRALEAIRAGLGKTI